jgi:multiple sugar transport system permease protein
MGALRGGEIVSSTLLFIGLILTPLLLGASIILAAVSLRLRLATAAVTVAAAAVIAYFVGRALWADPGVGLFAGAVTWGVLLLLIFQALLRPKMTWRAYKDARSFRRVLILHVVLIAGSLLFVLPFLWLFTTSLKEDEEMSKYPPVWVPRQQVKINLDGKPVGLAYAYVGVDSPDRKVRVKVAVLEEREDGSRLLRGLEPDFIAGHQFELPRSEVTKIKEFDPLWENYPNALKFLPAETNKGLVFLWNTSFLTAMVILGTLLSSSLVAFAFARLRWPGRDFLFVVLLATMMVPKAVTMMPVFLIFRQLGWIDTLRPLWAPAFFGNALYIFLLRQFFMTIPNELEESARIDGCSYFGIWHRIMLPLIKPALAAITIMTFMATWNDFINPLIYVSSPLRMPMSYALALYETAHGGEPGLLMAAATMMMLPVLLLFFFTQRYFIQGVTLTGIKG